MNSVSSSFVDRVRRFASAHDLLVNGGKYIVALSGGADSVSLLLVMKHLQETMSLKVEAAHCNFHLRGEESVRDELFCKDLCSHLGIRLHLAHFATKDYAQLHHVSIEMAARDLRYRWFEELRCDIGACAICVAHHRDDSVETVLLNLVRGTGILGLRGIQPRNGNIVRPLLCVSRNEIVDYLTVEEGQGYVTDSTNLVDDVKRNKVRLGIIPKLMELNPNVCQSIFETSLNMNEAFKVYDAAIKQSVADVCGVGSSADKPICISLERLLRQPSAECTLFHILSKCNFTPSQISNIYEALANKSFMATDGRKSVSVVSGKTVTSSTHELLYNRDSIIVQPKDFGVHSKTLCIPEEGNYVYAEDTKIRVAVVPIDINFSVSRERMCISVDADKVKLPLTIRPLNNGERFVPFGMSKSKLISDYMTDRKRSLFDKRRQLVVTDADNKVVWLVGERTDNRFRIDSSSTKALILELY